MVIAFLALIIIAAVILLPSLIYLKVYRDRINRKISHVNEKAAKPMIEPVRFFVIWSAAVFIFSILFIVIINNSGSTQTTDNLAAYDFTVFEGEDINEGYIGNFSMKENTGYTKVKQSSGDFTVTAFFSSEKYDGLHPTFVVFAEYTGSGEYSAQDVHGGFYGYDEKELSGKGYAGGDGDKIICFAGYVYELDEYSEYFEGQIYYMDNENMELAKNNSDDGKKYFNTGCSITVDFNNESLTVKSAE